MSAFEGLCAVIMAAGLIGIVIQILPGTLLVLGGVLLWATETQTWQAWTVLGVSVAAIAAAWVIKYWLAGRGLKKAEIGPWALVIGGIAGVVGFFVIPVIGLPLLFIAGIYVAERVRLRDHAKAWAATIAAIKATGITILVELGGALVAVAAWIVAIALM